MLIKHWNGTCLFLLIDDFHITVPHFNEIVLSHYQREPWSKHWQILWSSLHMYIFQNPLTGHIFSKRVDSQTVDLYIIINVFSII